MPIVPKGRRDRLGFYSTHVPVWAQDPQAIGTTAEMVAEVAELLAQAKQAYLEQCQLQSAARAATSRFNRLSRALRDKGAAIIMQVGLKAAHDGDGIYTKAQLPAPKRKSPIAPPGQPTSFRFDLDAVGNLTLRWKCKNPRGSVSTLYHVYRSIGSPNRFEYLGASGAKEFIDETIPRGAGLIFYRIKPTRSTCVGPVALFHVNFGTSGPSTPALIPKHAA